jgi:PAS domain S-box-containing protein
MRSKQSKRRMPTRPGTAAKASTPAPERASINSAGGPRGFGDIAYDLTRLLGSTGIALLFADREGRVRSFTPKMRDLFALSTLTVGQHLRHIERRFDDPGLLADIQTALDTAETGENEVVSHDGQVYVRLVLPYHSGHRVEGVILMFIGVNRRKLPTNAQRPTAGQNQGIPDSVSEYAVLTIDLDGRFVTWTPSAERLLGYTAGEAIGQRLELIHPEEERNRTVIDEEMALTRTQRSLTVERWHRRKDGSRFWGTGVLSSLYDEAGRHYGYVKVLRDNTERKLAMEALRQAKIDAELANSAKDFFLANVSHELRTPLSAMLLWAKLLSGKKRPSPRRVREGLEAIVKSAEEQQALIEDLMDTSRIAAGKMHLEMEAVSLVPLVQKAVDMIRLSARQKGLRLTQQLDARAGTVRADPLRLQQVMANLLNNAVKFTPEGGRVSVLMKRSGGDVEIQVRDTGQGISPEFIDRVFDRFTQADAAAIRANGGLGLGLSIARQLVLLHGGTILAHSDGPGKGTTFTVRLPLPAITRAHSSQTGTASKLPSLRGLNILLVEDMAQTRRALYAVLREAEATVVAVESAQEALREFNKSRPDLILSDIGLGKVSGHDLLGEIRRWERAQKSPPVPAMALTAYADERNRQLALQSGFESVLTKPVEPVELITKLADLWRMGRS